MSKHVTISPNEAADRLAIRELRDARIRTLRRSSGHKLRCLSVPSWLYPTLDSPESDISVGSEQALSGFQSPTTGNRVQKATRTETSVVLLAGEPNL